MSTIIDSALSQTLRPSKPKRSPARYSVGWVVALVLTDLAMFLAAAALASRLVFPTRPYFGEDGVFISSLVDIVIWFAIFARVGLYRRSFALSVRDEIYVSVGALCLGIAPQLILFTLVPAISTSRLVLVLSLLFSILLVSTTRASIHALREAEGRRRPRRIVIVGSPERAEQAAESLEPPDGTQILMLPATDLDQAIGDGINDDPDLNRVAWFYQAKAWSADAILLTEMLSPDALPYVIEAAARNRIDIAFAPPRIRAQAYQMTLRTDGHQVLIVPAPLPSCTVPARLLKRAADLAIASVVLLLGAPFMAVAALAILLEDGRPILFRQERVGRSGSIFELLKFRSMVVDAEERTGPVWSSHADPRTTRVGAWLRRLSIDELPQLFNVLHGDMSIVGPRPERPEFVEQFRVLLPRYDERHLVRPGITGWAQVHMDRVLDPSRAGEKLSFDLFYVEHWTLFLDVYIIVKTAAEMLFHRM
ncbi:MAG: sugar transferase [Candidatus Eremiobacteraeota bacterium]|nr:sugar transferase [Candidatus Eremiobacteraeota bacterium]MBV8366678.1 sugar transferase [Candidatus Eremiobacteraeota bacterium]